MMTTHSQPQSQQQSDGQALSRRELLRAGSLGLLGFSLSDLCAAQPSGQTQPPPKAKAKAVIQLWMDGGPCHIDTWDPKPEAGEDYAGPYRKPTPTNVSGIRIGQALPMLAKLADKYSIIRGMTHGNRAHETSTYIVQTGRLPSGDLVYPSIGAVVALKKGEAGYAGTLPPHITITNPLGRFSEAGFLGIRYKPYPTFNDPSADFRPQGGPGARPAQGGGPAAARNAPQAPAEKRVTDRRALLESLDALAAENNREFQAMDSFQDKAYNLITGEGKKAFNLALETEAVRTRYGRSRFGQSCLLARRLVEMGVPFVTVNSGGWDTHKMHFERMQAMLPDLDRGFSALLEDLAQRGLLDGTIVVWWGEFGRTPKIDKEPPWNGGRNHWGDAFSCVVAGGGFKGGQVVGVTDPKGEAVKDRPVYPWDLAATMYHLLGIDPMGRLPHPRGCVTYVTPLATGDVKSSGLVKEII